VSTYATPEEVRAYVCMEAAVLLPKDDADLEAMIETAELDVDRQLAADLPRDPVTGRKLTLAVLSVVQVAALSRATAAAVEWRAMIGEDVLAEGEDGLEAVGSVQLGETPRPPAPKMIEELAGHGFAWRSGTVAPPPEDAAADLP
jgi:hypothetical protein